MSLQLSTKCRHCGVGIKVRASLIGQIARCPACKQKFEVTSFSSATDEDAMSVISVSETLNSGKELTAGGSSSQDAPPEGGVALGRFRLQKVLGQGGFGKVYQAYDPQLDRLLAIKVPTFSNDDTKRVQRFLTEAKAAARLRHPNIVPTFESGQLDGRYFIAAQFISGRPLNEVIKSGEYQRREALEWVVSLAGALSYAHANDIVHRDIKPHNVMIDENGQPQLMDFGLARRGDEESTQTTDGTLLGTPAYMPPEQARGALSEIGPWSDQYSLGVILYEVLTGQRPFQGESHAVIHKVLTEEPANPRSVDKTIPRDLESICRKAIAKLPDDRYENCDAFAEDLRRWLRGESTIARPLSVFRQFGRWVRKNPVIGAAAVVCLAAVGSVAILATAVAIDQGRRNEAAENATSLAEQRKNVAEQANATLASNYKVLEDTVNRRNKAVSEADEANRRAQEQADLANKERQRARQLLLDSQLQQLSFEKQRLLIPEAMQTIDLALATSRDLQRPDLVKGLSLDQAFLESISAIQNPLPQNADEDIGRRVALNEHVSLSPQGSQQWRLYHTGKSAEFGDSFQLDLQLDETTGVSDAVSLSGRGRVLAERLIGVAVTDSKLIWVTTRSDVDARFWGALRRHEVALETGTCTVSDGPQIMPVATESLSIPVWLGRQGRKIAYRSRTLSSDIIVADTATFETTATIKSPEMSFHAAVFDASEEEFAIAEHGDNDRFSLISYPVDGEGSKTTIFRGVESLTLEPSQDLAVAVKDRRTEVRSLRNGAVLAEFPSLTGPIIGRKGSNGATAVVNSQRLLLADRNAVIEFRLDPMGVVEDFLLMDRGQALCSTSDRRFLLDLDARLVLGSTEKQSHPGNRITRQPLFNNISVGTPHIHPRAPNGSLSFGGFIDADHALLVEPELHECYQVSGNLIYRYEVERLKSLAVVPLSGVDSPAVVTPLDGFAGRQKLISVSASEGDPAANVDKKLVVAADVLQRLFASEDGVTLSHQGKFAVVRNVEAAPTLAMYDLERRAIHGDQHLTESPLLAPSLATDFGHDSVIRQGQARFNSTDELFVYRVTADTLGIVSTLNGKRIGQPLKIPADRLLQEVGWTVDSKHVWAVTTGNNTQLRIEMWDIVNGTLAGLDVPLSDRFAGCSLSGSGHNLMLRSASGQIAVFDTSDRTVRTFPDSGGTAGATISGFWGLQENVFQMIPDPATGSPAFRLWNTAGKDNVLVPTEKSTLVLPISAGNAAIQGRIDLSAPSSGVTRQIRLWDITAATFTETALKSSIGFRSVLVSPNGEVLLTVDDSRKAQLWHADSGQTIGPPLSDMILWPPSQGLQALIQDYHFSPNGRSIIVTQNSRVISIISIPTTSAVAAEALENTGPRSM